MVAEYLLYVMFWRAEIPVLVPTRYESMAECMSAGNDIKTSVQYNSPLQFYCIEVRAK